LKNICVTPPEQLRPGQRADWLADAKRFSWVYVDFQDPRLGTREGLMRHILACLKLPVPVPCDLDHFLDVMGSQLQAQTVILMDEIGAALGRYRELDDTFWEGLRSLATGEVRDNLSFVLASHEPPTQLVRHSGHSSPFFNIFAYTATLGPLSDEEARALVASSPKPFSRSDFEWIITQSGRWPLLLQILCRECLASLDAGGAEDTWRDEAVRQIAPFQHLRGVP